MDIFGKRGKISELACGYGGSVGALKNMGAVEMGVPRRMNYKDLTTIGEMPIRISLSCGQRSETQL